jgi:alpha-D-xyloside xylohydrolase
VYSGANGHFTLYEDEGTNLDYQHGAYATIPLSFDRATGTLTIGQRSGEFPGMYQTRTFHIRWMTQQAHAGDDFAAPADDTVVYSGAPVRIHCRTCAAGAGRA